MRILVFAAAAALASAGLADGISVSAGGVDFVVPPKGGLMVRKAGGKLARVLSFNMRVGGETGKVAAFPDGRDDVVRIAEDSAARCVVRADRSLATRAMAKDAPQVAWDAARLVIDYVFRKDVPGVIVVERLVAKKPFTFFSWNVPIGCAFSRFSIDGGEWRSYPTTAEFRAQAGGYRTKAGAYLVGETPDGERWWMGREFGTFCPYGNGKPGAFYALSDTPAASHGNAIADGEEVTLAVCVGRLRADADIELLRAFRKGDGSLPVPMFGGDWSHVPAAAWRGETKDYRPVAGLHWNGAKDLSFSVRLAQDDAGLLVRAAVTDDTVLNAFSGKDAGLGDSVHVAFANAACTRRLDRVLSALRGRRTADGYEVEFRIGWDELARAGIPRDGGVRFNLCVTDQDGGNTNYENWMGIADGIIGGRDASLYPLLDLSGVGAPFEPERPTLPSHDELRRKIDEIAAMNAKLPSGGADEYTSCMKAMTEYFLEFMRSDLEAKDVVNVSHRVRKIDDVYRYYMDDRVARNAESLLELQRELAARQLDLASGKVRPVVTVKHPKGVRPVIADGGFKVAGRELLLIGPDTWTNVKGWRNDDVGVIAATGFNQLDVFYIGGTNYADVVRRCEEGGLYCVWGSAADTDENLLAPQPEWPEEKQNAYRNGMGYSRGSLVPTNPSPNFVFQVSFPEQWTRKREATEEWAKEFRRHLGRKFGSPEGLNASLGTSYRDWGEIDFAAALANPALKYESFVYRMKTNMARGIPQQRWIARRFGLPRSTHYSTHYNIASLDPLVTLADFEALWSMFDIVGFDGGFGLGGSEWAIDFPKGGFELDLARSVYPEKPVANNENHVVGDGTYDEHTREETYLSNMLAFLLGQNSSSVWDWANTRHTYGEYVFTRAHMYREMVRCALDLRCHAEEIGAFRHAPNPPFRILHSLPSLAERDPYVRSLYGLYGACSFTGWATRFLTERHLAKGDFKGAKVVVVPDARRVSDVTFKALEAFSRKGGIVLVDGDLALARDQWGKSAPERAAAIRRFRRFPSVASRARFEALNAALAEKGVQPPLALTTADGRPPFGVMWRTARTAKGDEVVFIANLSRSPVEICMPGAWTDVLAQEAKMPSRFSLEPCGLKICRRPR